MGVISRLLGIDAAVEKSVDKTLKETTYPWLAGVPAYSPFDPSFRPDPDGFLPMGWYRKRSQRGDNPQAYLDENQLRLAVEQSRSLVVSNEYARNGLTNRRNYIVGTGFKVTAEPVDPDAPNDALVKKTNEWLQRYAAIVKRAEKEKESVFRGDRDGEVFIRLFKGNVLEWKFIEPEYIGNWDGKTPFGIKTDPQDITKIIHYLVKGEKEEPAGSGQFVEFVEEVPADEMIHVKLNTDSGIKRGLPFLYPVYSILRKIESTNENMATNVAIGSSIAYMRRHKIGLRSAIETNNDSEADFQGPAYPSMAAGATANYKAFRPGTILDVPDNVEYEFPANSINLGGVVSVKESLLQTAAAGMGIPEYMLTSDASNGNLSTTQIAESPMILGMLAMQHQWADVFGQGMFVDDADMGLTWKAIEYAVEQEQLDAAVLTEIQLNVEGPSIEVRDKAQETTRNLQLADAGIISRDKVANKEGHAKAHKSDAEMEQKKQADLQNQLALKSAGKGLKEEFDEEKHPRDGDGKFTDKGGEGEKGDSGNKNNGMPNTDIDPRRFAELKAMMRPAKKSDLNNEFIYLWHGTTEAGAKGIEKNGVGNGTRGRNASADPKHAAQYPEDTGAHSLVLLKAKVSELDVDPNDQQGDTVEDGLFPKRFGSSCTVGKHEPICSINIEDAHSPDAAIKALQKGDLDGAIKAGATITDFQKK